MLKSITGTAGTPWSCQEVEWSLCCFGELLTWRPGPSSKSLLGLTHSRVVWSPVTSAFLEKVLITITEQGYTGMRSSVKHAHKCLSTFPTWSSWHHPVTRTHEWDWTWGSLSAYPFTLEVLLLSLVLSVQPTLLTCHGTWPIWTGGLCEQNMQKKNIQVYNFRCFCFPLTRFKIK